MAASTSINRTRLMQIAAGNPSVSRTRLLQIMANSTSVDRTYLLRTIAGNTDPSPTRTQLLQEIAGDTSVNRTYLWRLIAGEAGAAQSLNNAQKLALPANTPVGTVVQVTDGFVLVFDNPDFNGLYVADGTAAGKTKYHSTKTIGLLNDYSIEWDESGQWALFSSGHTTEGSQIDTNDDEFPWLSPWYGATTLTHPAVQALAAPSAAQGGVFVAGGTQDGVFVEQVVQTNGRASYSLLGDADALHRIEWGGDRWLIIDDTGDGFIYYSLDDVATPDLAIDWLNVSDDSPAGITVTSVSEGEIVAGLAVTNDGVTNGSSYVSQPFHGRQYYMGLNGGGSNNMHWDTDFNVWTDDVGTWTTDNVAFPWQGSDNGGGGHTGATFARNDVASEANWTAS